MTSLMVIFVLLFLAFVHNQPVPTKKPLKVLVVEIRDGDDMNPHIEPDDLQHQSAGPPPPAA
jgi:hypothetical protein